jgi:hypothetical protein
VSPILESIGSVKGFGWGALLASTAFESIATVTLSTDASIATFSSIPSTFKHLQIRCMSKPASGVTSYGYAWMKLNETAGYSNHSISGNGSSASAAGATGNSFAEIRGGMPYTGAVGTNIFGVAIIDIIDYASTTKNKTIRSFAGWDGNGAAGGNDGVVGLHSSLATGITTTAVSSVSMYCYASGANFLAGSTFALYGIKGA